MLRQLGSKHILPGRVLHADVSSCGRELRCKTTMQVLRCRALAADTATGSRCSILCAVMLMGTLRNA